MRLAFFLGNKYILFHYVGAPVWHLRVLPGVDVVVEAKVLAVGGLISDPLWEEEYMLGG